jgi:hypothetical protein
MLRFNGIGERVMLAMYNNNDARTKPPRTRFYEVIRWAAAREWRHHPLGRGRFGSGPARSLRAAEPQITDHRLRWSIAPLTTCRPSRSRA